MIMTESTTHKTKQSVLPISQQLKKYKYVFINGRQMTLLLSTHVGEVIRFKNCWNQLERDRYMADGGKYRYRRYGQFTKLARSKEIVMMPHEPYVQPSYINTLNGDIERHFEPLTDRFVTSPVLEKLLKMMSEIYDDVEGEPQNWNIRLHPYRITATEAEAGEPTPEGLHRDGVTYIASMMINKINVSGGETRITDDNQNELERITLDKTFDIVMADDAATMHEVSTITPASRETSASRDVLVIAFTKMEK
ncbi:2OG-Fe dioxygenase family protein [Vibrio vulnificus]|uniref:2OG-Fe dioxygenase family protein n=1 Tax=Vibrio vulnificus TaxID=672 RepID=UPI002FD226BC